ncbi:MAG: glycerol-3-phosphate acyltransferase [Anaerolineae bacterium]
MDSQVSLALMSAYLLGSIPSAYLVARWVAGVDIRTVGDGNVGGKNVWEQVGPIPGVAVALMDVGKGTAAVMLAQRLALSEPAILLTGVVAVLGHDFMLFLRFRGGQGMATMVGVFLVLLPRETIVILLIGGLLLLVTRHWEFSTGVGFALLPVLTWWAGRPPRLLFYPIALLPTIGVKKIMDMPIARRIAARKQEMLPPEEGAIVPPKRHQG